MTEIEAEMHRAALELLEQALDLPPDARIAYVENRVDVPEDVRKHALDLLLTDRDPPARLRTGGAGDTLDDPDAPPPPLPGYRVVRQLGRGGMGAVWLAERDGADFTHQVAIKLIKPGVLVEALVERFRRERQILAQLNHPHIARLYDGGETDDGQPYIVMEYVEGRTLWEWLTDERPLLQRRLAMFRQIAQAVEFAHQNLIIHRDLTPSNVLVTASEQAKLIDFGIARPQSEDDQALHSTFSALSLTPGFAAPERARGEASNTLTDVYSLGRILALLVEHSGEAELDAIVGRASAEEPSVRYPSVGELIEDIDCFGGDRPIDSFSTARWYRFGKFARRERRLVAASAAILLALVGGLGGTAWAYERSQRARATAEHRFDQLRDLARFQLFDLYDRLDSVIGNTAARVELADRAQAYLLELAESHSDDRQLQLETAQGFIKLAKIQGVPAHPNFGEPQQARENLDRAETMLEPLAAQGMAEARNGLAMVDSYRSLLLAHADSKPKEARAAYEQAERVLAEVPEAERGWGWMNARRAQRVAALAWADLEHDNAVMTAHADLLEREIGDWPKTKRGGYEEGFDRALVEMHRAIVRQNENTPASLQESVRRYRSADRLFGAVEAKFPNDPQVLYWRGWNAYYGYAAAAMQGDNVGAGVLLAQARTSAEDLLKLEEADHSLVTFAERLREAQAQFFSNTGRHDEAIALQEQIIAGRQAKLGPDRRSRTLSDLAFGRAVLGGIYRQAGRREGACSNWMEAEKLLAELAAREALSNYVGYLRPGLQANISRCRAGAPVGEFEVLARG
ncbi:MAG TPA: serine/threonine-protein kinase [Croceibacterium sp.]